MARNVNLRLRDSNGLHRPAAAAGSRRERHRTSALPVSDGRRGRRQREGANFAVRIERQRFLFRLVPKKLVEVKT